MDLVGELGGFSHAPLAAPSAAPGMSPRQKIALALQMHQGLFPQRSGMGGLGSLGQAGLGLLGMGMMRPPTPQSGPVELSDG